MVLLDLRQLREEIILVAQRKILVRGLGGLLRAIMPLDVNACYMKATALMACLIFAIQDNMSDAYVAHKWQE